MAKKYNCPFCDYRNTSDNLIRHIDKKHQEDLPEGYTAGRMVFNIRNKRDHGTCLICKQETEWNENTQRYNSLCGRKECHDKYVARFEKNMIKVYKKPRLLDDEFQQEKMLSHRRISGTYRFSTGGTATYTGKFEQKALEFLDKVMNVKVYELMVPGPVLEYTDEDGTTRKYIPDIYWIDLNLLIEVKDGGSNPNRRNMPEYRSKQMAKEKMITDRGAFNYLRLTNNNFAQLLEIVAEIKEKAMNDDSSPVIRINESSKLDEVGPVGGMPPNYTQSGYLIYKGYDGLKDGSDLPVNRSVFLSNDIISDKIIGKDKNNKLKQYPKDTVEESDIKIYKFLGSYKKFLEVASKESLDESFYEALSGRKEYSKDQIDYDPLFSEINLNKYLSSIYEEVTSIRSMMEYNPVLPVMNKDDIQKMKTALEGYEDKLSIAEDKDGYFMYNKKTGKRTKSVKDIALLKVKDTTLLQESFFYRNIRVPSIDFLEEKTSIKNDYDSAKEIMDSLSKEDLKLTDMDHEYRDVKVLYRYIYRSGNSPVGFIDVYPLNGKQDRGFILLAVKDGYRNKGIASMMISKALDYAMDNNMKYLEWRCNKANESSYKSALKNGFKLIRETKGQYILRFDVESLSEAADDNIQYSDSDIELAKEYNITSSNTMIYPVETETELEELWDEYNSQSSNVKDDCNAMSMRLFHRTCEQLYYKLKHDFLIKPSKPTYHTIYRGIREDAIPDMDKTIHTNSLMGNAFAFVSDMPYFTPDELKKLNFVPDDSIKKWYDEYNKLFTTGTVSGLFTKLNKERIEKLHKAKTKDEKLSLAWNPEVAFTPKIRVSIDKKINEAMRINIVQESTLPYSIDRRGNLIIKKFWNKKDAYNVYEQIYQELHKNLIAYDRHKAYTLMEFEMIKLYDLKSRVDEDYMNDKNNEKMKNLRSRIMNDYDKYLDIVLAHNKKFNIRQRYINSSLNRDTIKINDPTIKATKNALKALKDIII